MYLYLSISNAGADAGPFDLYSNVDNYISAFATDVPKDSLEKGYPTKAPDGTTDVKIKSVNQFCNNSVIVPITTTTTTTII